MSKQLTILLCVLMTLVAGCDAQSTLNGIATHMGNLENQQQATGTALGGQIPLTATPIATEQMDATREDDETPLATTDCGILTSADAAAALGAAVEQRLNEGFTTDQVAFSLEQVSALQSDCSYERLQAGDGFVYNVNRPNKATPEAWVRIWTNAKAGDARPIAGVGDDAYYLQGSLMVKKGNVYLMFTIKPAGVDTDTAAGVNLVIAIEKSVALKALSRLP
ncbi:MAG: hypothetical protein U0350_43185 [Caldilineaceae bacterium]